VGALVGADDSMLPDDFLGRIESTSFGLGEGFCVFSVTTSDSFVFWFFRFSFVGLFVGVQTCITNVGKGVAGTRKGRVGSAVSLGVGFAVGFAVGLFVGFAVGFFVGFAVGVAVGGAVSKIVTICVGEGDGGGVSTTNVVSSDGGIVTIGGFV